MCLLGPESLLALLLVLGPSLDLRFRASAVPLEVNASGPDDDAAHVLTQEVPFGETATLLCRSNDETHNFLYWHLEQKNTIVGPGNPYDDGKFRYEVLSGNLTIKAVSDNEEGLYNCVSRGVLRDDINIRSVRMIVMKDWEEADETDPGLNLFKAVVVIGTLMVLAGVGYIAYRVWKDRYRHPAYLVPSDDEEEDSGEEIFRAPERPRPNNKNIILAHNNSTESFDSPGISTDFTSILNTANQK